MVHHGIDAMGLIFPAAETTGTLSLAAGHSVAGGKIGKIISFPYIEMQRQIIRPLFI